MTRKTSEGSGANHGRRFIVTHEDSVKSRRLLSLENPRGVRRPEGRPVFYHALRFGRVANDCRVSSTLDGSHFPKTLEGSGAQKGCRFFSSRFGRVTNDYRLSKTLDGSGAQKGSRFSFRRAQ